MNFSVLSGVYLLCILLIIYSFLRNKEIDNDHTEFCFYTKSPRIYTKCIGLEKWRNSIVDFETNGAKPNTFKPKI